MTDQTGKVFIALGQDVRQCLVCEGLFTRRAAFEHFDVSMHADNQHENLLKMMQTSRLADHSGCDAIFVNTSAFELSRWRGGRCCMGASPSLSSGVRYESQGGYCDPSSADDAG